MLKLGKVWFYIQTVTFIYGLWVSDRSDNLKHLIKSFWKIGKVKAKSSHYTFLSHYRYLLNNKDADRLIIFCSDKINLCIYTTKCNSHSQHFINTSQNPLNEMRAWFITFTTRNNTQSYHIQIMSVIVRVGHFDFVLVQINIQHIVYWCVKAQDLFRSGFWATNKATVLSSLCQLYLWEKMIF